MALAGVFGKPWVDLSAVGGFVDTAGLPRLDDEITLALGRVPTEYTGGSHRSMGIVPPSWLASESRFGDYGEAIRGMTDREFLVFASLADAPHVLDLSARESGEFGEERAYPLSRAQMRWLETRFRVYFPWKTYLELIPGGRWVDKSRAEGKHWTRDALVHFPRTVAWIRSLPMESIGSVKLLGLAPNDHGTVHRDADPAEKTTCDEFVTFSPRADKRLFVWDEEARAEHVVTSSVYWFNDSDWHGVHADPWFRYSIRVDGRFTPAFREAVAAEFG
ncbi:MAG: hypothetical protein U0169_10230 [Polyangiaceae bacterium]